MWLTRVEPRAERGLETEHRSIDRLLVWGWGTNGAR